MDQAEKTVKSLLKIADIEINGKRPWDIQVRSPRFYERGLRGSLDFGESYMDGDWDTDQLDETIARIIKSKIDQHIKKGFRLILFLARNKFFNTSTIKRSYQVGEQHYDVGNELYEKMLDHDMNYTCGYWKGLDDPLTAWKNPLNLDKAQTAKMDLICRKLGLKKGMKVLDTGCGFGNFARYAAVNYGVSVVGCTVSKEQAIKARDRCKGLPVKIYHQDYRELKLNNEFDRVASIGIMEHITHKNYESYLRIACNALKEDGLMLLHTIGYEISSTAGEPWSEKYIFPNSHLPSIAQMAKAAEGKFVFEDLQNFGLYYYPTLMSWYRNFEKNWKELSDKYPDKYDERFYRMWRYYLLSFAGSFKTRNLQLWQIVLSKDKNPEVYEGIR